MKRTAKLFLALVFSLLVLPFNASAQTPSIAKRLRSEPVAPMSRNVLDINNLWLTVRNDGVIGYDNGGHLVTYPMDVGGLVYSDNLIWVGKVRDGGAPELRTGGGTYASTVGVVPGRIVSSGIAENPSSPAVRIYRIRHDYKYADLLMDAAGFYHVSRSAVTSEMIATVRDQYDKDWKEWPWQKGAPFVDRNGNGKMEADESPGLQNADQVVWFAYNDLDEAVCRAFSGDPPIGLEVQVTLWAYNGVPNLGDLIFKRYRLIYKGTSVTPANAVIDSLYLSQWVDPDVGDFADDLGGCDSLLSLGYAFSASNPDREFKSLGGPNPAVGYAILQGPVVQGSQNDDAIFDFALRKGVKNLAMTSFLLNPTGDPLSEPRAGSHSYWFWNVARGFMPFGQGTSTRPWVDIEGNATKFMYGGDPVTRTGWIDGLGTIWGTGSGVGYSMAQGERRIMLNTGPFTMALGDTQEIVIAIIASAAPDGPQNSVYLKNLARYLHGIYPKLGEYAAQFKKEEFAEKPQVPDEFRLEQNFPNPFNPSTTIRYTIPIDANVKLAIYDALGREIRVLQSGRQSAGSYNVVWDGRDSQNRLVPSGVYLYRLTANYLQLTRKMIIVR